MLTISLKKTAGYTTDMITVKASDGRLTSTWVVKIRQNRPPVVGTDSTPVAITVGTQPEADKATKTVNVAIPDDTDTDQAVNFVLIAQPVPPIATIGDYDFADDVGDTLTLVGEANVGDRTKLSITNNGVKLSIVGTAQADAGRCYAQCSCNG